jgi:4-amino-4-deoxy-L-arabinose transferase-like glycosyltransferase
VSDARPRDGRFALGLAGIAVLGLGVRLAYVIFARRNVAVWGDAFFYHHGANLLAHGKGFIAPFQYLAQHTRVQAADHPPLYLLFLAIPSALRLESPLTHMVWSSLLGTGTLIVSGLLGRRVAGVRAGLLAAFLVAVYPNIWVYDGALLSETMAIFVATLAILLTYRAWERPSLGRIASLGAACGAAALARSELALLTPALLLPVALSAGGVPIGVRLQRLGAGALVALVVVAPWVGYNLVRFEHPVLLSSQLEPTLAGANCRDTYHGRSLGLLTTTCLAGTSATDDQSVTAERLRPRVTRFVRANLSRVPVVVAVRVGRVTGLYRPAQQVDVDVFLEGRERWLAIAGLVSYYCVAAGAIAGAIVLRRRRSPPLFPLLVLPGIVLVTVALTYGTTRFRAAAETSLAVLAAVAVDALWTAIAAARRTGRPGETPG